MASKIIPVAVFDCVVFGATGDLTLRKLLPALYYRFRDGQMPADSRIIAAARSDFSDETYRERAMSALQRHIAPADWSENTGREFCARVTYTRLDAATEDGGWDDLRRTLAQEPERVRVFYLATSPDLYGPISLNIGAHDLITPRSRVVLEKPIGHDLASAREINDQVGQVFSEAQTFRIDHYLGKETVQNLLALRFANSIFERLWNTDVIDHVQLTVAETVGVEGRAWLLRRFRRAARHGAESPVAAPLPHRDGQSRVAGRKRGAGRETENPARPPADRRRTRPLRARCAANTRMARSTGGRCLATPPTSEPKAEAAPKPSSRSRPRCTLGVGRTSRSTSAPASACRRNSPASWCSSAHPRSRFSRQCFRNLQPNKLIIRLQPEEGDAARDDDQGARSRRAAAAPDRARHQLREGVRDPLSDAYERLLMDTVRGNATLFMRRDEVEAAWSWVEPIIEAWSSRPEAPRPYPAGSWGPTASIALIERDGRTWHEELS